MRGIYARDTKLVFKAPGRPVRRRRRRRRRARPRPRPPAPAGAALAPARRSRRLDNQSIHNGGYDKFEIGQRMSAKLDRDLSGSNTARIVKGFTAATLNENFDVGILVKHRHELVIWPVR